MSCNHGVVVVVVVVVVVLTGVVRRALCSNMPEGGGLSYGGAGEYPEYSWEIVCGEGHTYIRSGDRVALSAIGEKCDVWS